MIGHWHLQFFKIVKWKCKKSKSFHVRNQWDEMRALKPERKYPWKLSSDLLKPRSCFFSCFFIFFHTNHILHTNLILPLSRHHYTSVFLLRIVISFEFDVVLNSLAVTHGLGFRGNNGTFSSTQFLAIAQLKHSLWLLYFLVLKQQTS